VAALAYLGVTLYLGTVPSTGLPGSDHDKLLHAACFGGMVIVTFPAMNALFGRFPSFAPWLDFAAAGYAIAVGALLEILQSMLPRRHADFADLAADAVGAAVGLLVLKGARAWTRTAPS
jgi:VanZ family protein